MSAEHVDVGKDSLTDPTRLSSSRSLASCEETHALDSSREAPISLCVYPSASGSATRWRRQTPSSDSLLQFESKVVFTHNCTEPSLPSAVADEPSVAGHRRAPPLASRV